MEAKPKQIAVKIILIGLFLFTTLRLFTSMAAFGRESLQLDFSAFYTAGQSLNHGYPVYENNILRTPPVWDGAAFYKHSRFLYPPLVATLFRPWALLPYKVAKHIWMLFNLICVYYTVFIVSSLIHLKRNAANYLILGISVALFYPTLIYLERGQIDAVVLVLILLSVKLTIKNDRPQYTPGLILAAATLFKLHCIFLIPFLLIKRKWKPLQGYILGLIGLLLLSFLFNGISATTKYLSQEMPRIAKYGEDGTKSMMLPKTAVKRRRAIYSEETSKDHVNYRMTTLKFVDNATLTRKVSLFLNKYEINVSRSVVSVLLFSCFFLLITLWQSRFKDSPKCENPVCLLVYWQIALIVVLLTSPLTWVMNTVWLLPTVPILLRQTRHIKSKAQAFYFGVCATGLCIAAIPDPVLHSLIGPNGSALMNDKYIISETFMLLALLALLASICTPETA